MELNEKNYKKIEETREILKNLDGIPSNEFLEDFLNKTLQEAKTKTLNQEDFIQETVRNSYRNLDERGHFEFDGEKYFEEEDIHYIKHKLQRSFEEEEHLDEFKIRLRLLEQGIKESDTYETQNINDCFKYIEKNEFNDKYTFTTEYNATEDYDCKVRKQIEYNLEFNNNSFYKPMGIEEKGIIIDSKIGNLQSIKDSVYFYADEEVCNILDKFSQEHPKENLSTVYIYKDGTIPQIAFKTEETTDNHKNLYFINKNSGEIEKSSEIEYPKKVIDDIPIYEDSSIAMKKMEYLKETITIENTKQIESLPGNVIE